MYLKMLALGADQSFLQSIFHNKRAFYSTAAKSKTVKLDSFRFANHHNFFKFVLFEFELRIFHV